MCESPTINTSLRKHAEPSMVCSADDLAGWRDFPKGLRVLLLSEDSSSAADIKSKLERMDYIVSLFSHEKEALNAVSNKTEGFHVAIVEVTTGNSLGCFRFLETARGLPTIMVSEVQCISTMMKCIALGAAEFLQKPLSEDKLRNIWQHVVHKAFNAGSAILSKSLKPIKATVASILQLQLDGGNTELTDRSSSIADATEADEQQRREHEASPPNDRFPAPSTPQLEQSSRSLDDRDCQDQLNCSMEESKEHAKDSLEQTKLRFSESKSVDNNTCNNTSGEIRKEEPSTPADFFMEDEIDSAYGSKTDEYATYGEQVVPSPHLNGESHAKLNVEGLNQTNSPHPSSTPYGSRASKKRIKVDWTPDLHKRFVRAVEQLGIDQAIPSKILELMKVDGLTRHNVASHLQKYRMRKRHILPKDDDRRWQQHGNPVPRAYAYKHFVALPPAQSSCGLPPGQVYPVWGHPNYHHPGFQMWSNTGYLPWQPCAEYWPWKTYPRMHADAWGCPVVPPQQPYAVRPHYHPQIFDASEHLNGALGEAYDLHPAEEEIDEVVREALSKPWLPLPLGLKPPSTESVLAELHRLGVRRVPPR